MDEVLGVCDGWPMALESVGALAEMSGRNWGQVQAALRNGSASSLAGSIGQWGLSNIWESSIGFAEKLAVGGDFADRDLFCGLDTLHMRQQYGEKWLSNRVAALAVFDAPRAVGKAVLALQLGTTCP